MNTGPQFCTHCGASTQAGAGFCTACGSQLGGAVAAQPAHPHQPHLRAVYRQAKRTKAKLFSFRRFFAFSGVSLLGIGLADGWKETLNGVAPLHAILGVPTPSSAIGGSISLAFHGFLAGVVIGLIRSLLSGQLLKVFQSPAKPMMMFFMCAIVAVLAPDAMGDDGGIIELARGAAIVPNLTVLIGSSAAAGAGLSAGVGVVTVIVNGAVSSVSRPPTAPSSGRTGRETGPGVSNPAQSQSPPAQSPIGRNDNQGNEQEEEEPPNFTLDIQTDGGRTNILADDRDELGVSATVFCDKPEIDTSQMAGSITFTAGGPAVDWVQLGQRMTSGSTAMIDVKAKPPTPESVLLESGAILTVRLTLGRAVFSGVVNLTVESSDYHLEIVYDTE